MTEEWIAPRSIRVLADALRPTVNKIEERMNWASTRRKWLHGAHGFIERNLREIVDEIDILTEIVEGELNDALAGDADDAQILRAATRLEMQIERFLNSYDKVRNAKCRAEDARGLSLLAEVYRDLPRQILAWLNEILEFADQPLVALRKRGLSPDGDGQITFKLTLEPPRELNRLMRWLKLRAAKLEHSLAEPEPPPEQCSDYGLLALVLAAFGLGWMFGGDE